MKLNEANLEQNNMLCCSVIVPTYNRRQLLRQTLLSLTRQSMTRETFEVLVVDDGSSDNSVAEITAFANQLNLRYFYQPDEGYRVALARNIGIRHANAPICVFIDSGVIAHSNCLQAHIESHQAFKPAAVIGYVYGFNEDNEDAEQIEAQINITDIDATIDNFRQQARWLDLREEFYAKYGDNIGELPAPWLMYWTCNVSATTEQLRNIGMFDEAFRSWGGEDIDLAYRLHRDGAYFILNRAAESIHHPHPKSYQQNMATVASNYRYFAKKYGTPITALIPDNHFLPINEMIRTRGLPSCEDYLRTLKTAHQDNA